MCSAKTFRREIQSFQKAEFKTGENEKHSLIGHSLFHLPILQIQYFHYQKTHFQVRAAAKTA